MAVVSVVLGWVIAGRVLRPLRAMTAATRRISADSLHERLAMPGPADELTDLADTIDGLLERLEGAFAAQRRFIANASHELRTPLATMRASLDVAVAKPGPVPAQTVALAGRVRTELDQVDRLLEGCLVLARAQHGDLPGHATLQLGDVVSAALGGRAEAIAARNLTVAHAGGGAWVQGSATLLGRMVDNVLDNAIGHKPGRRLDPRRRRGGRAGRAAGRRDRRTGPRPGAGGAAGPAVPPARRGPDRLRRRGRAGALDCRGHRRRARRDPGAAGPGRGRTAGQHRAAAGGPPGAGGSPGVRVLVVEDARSLADVLVEGLRDQGMAVDAARDGLEAAAKLNVNAYDVVVLDRDLPGIHGDALCQMITERDDRVMVLMLTAADSPGNRVAGLGLGADDYLAKPFHFPELVLRIRALARRQPAARARVLRGRDRARFGPAHGHPGRTAARPVGQGTRRPGVAAAGRPGFLRAEDLLEQVWDEHADPFTNTVAVTVLRLRRKLGEPPLIDTVIGGGYRIP